MSDNLNSSTDDESVKLALIRVSVPEGLLEQAVAIAKLEGWKPSELHRVLWAKGLAAYVQESNVRLENIRLRNELNKD